MGIPILSYRFSAKSHVSGRKSSQAFWQGESDSRNLAMYNGYMGMNPGMGAYGGYGAGVYSIAGSTWKGLGT